MQKAVTCCFTGHRPEKLPWGENERDPRCLRLKADLRAELEWAYNRGFRHFLCGMARGADLYFCEAVLELRERHSDVTLEAALPCVTQSDRWPRRDRERHAALLARCDLETLVQQNYDKGCMQRRDRYMVDRSALLVAVYNGGGSGGTMYTLAYALRTGVETRVLDPEEI